MSTLDVYAAFLTARWDEIEEVDLTASDETPPWEFYICGDRMRINEAVDVPPGYLLADLAAKRAILELAQWQHAQDDGRTKSDYLGGRIDGACDRLRHVVRHLAEPFRTHPDHPENS